MHRNLARHLYMGIVPVSMTAPQISKKKGNVRCDEPRVSLSKEFKRQKDDEPRALVHRVEPDMPMISSLQWKVPKASNEQERRLKLFKEAFASCDIIQSFHSAELIMDEIPVSEWPEYVKSLIGEANDEDTKGRLKRMQFTKRSKGFQAFLKPDIRGSKFTLKLVVMGRNGDTVYYGEAKAEKGLDVTHRDVRWSGGIRSLAKRLSLGATELYLESKQSSRDQLEKDLMTMLTDDTLVSLFVAQQFGPMLKSNGIDVQYIDCE